MSMASDAAISVTMDGGQVVLRPCGQLDREAIEALLGLIAGAEAAGAVAIVDLEQVAATDRAAALRALGRTCLVTT